MLAQDLRPSAPHPAGENPVGSRGTTAFQWFDSFVYDEATHQAVMTGHVRIAHKDDENAEPLDLLADRVTADVQPADASAKKGASPDDVAANIRRVTADGSVMLKSKGTTVDALHVEYDPIAHVLTARGSDRQPVVVTSADGRSDASAAEIRFNVKENRLERVSDFRGQGR
jgi:lipopolysaccharide export system protein LptA